MERSPQRGSLLNVIDAGLHALGLSSDRSGQAGAVPLRLSAALNVEGDDVAKLDRLTMDNVVQLIQSRYEEAPNGKPPQYEKIHTRAGQVIVVVNPFCSVKEQLYTPGQRAQYHRAAQQDEGMAAADAEDLPPHIYEVVAKAYHGVKSENRPQAIVINGESGAGKTETTKASGPHKMNANSHSRIDSQPSPRSASLLA